MFILRQDLLRVMPKEYIDVLIENEDVANVEIATAIEYVRSYLQHRYDVDWEMRPFETYTGSNPIYRRVVLEANPYFSAEKYRQGSIVQSEGMVWVALRQNTGQNPEGSQSWKLLGYIGALGMIGEQGLELIDDRNQSLVTTTADLAVYQLLTRHQPRQVSEISKSRYNEAKRWLEMANQNRLQLSLRLKPEPLNRIAWGSNTKRVNDY